MNRLTMTDDEWADIQHEDRMEAARAAWDREREKSMKYHEKMEARIEKLCDEIATLKEYVAALESENLRLTMTGG